MSTTPGVCPECKGAGGWANTARGRGVGGQMMTMCDACNGTGQQPAQPDYDPIAAVEAVEHYEASAKALDALDALDAQPESGESLPRIGLQWNGPRDFVCTPMADGYWTPWHVAHDALTAAQQRIATLTAEVMHYTAGTPHPAEQREAELREALRTYGWHKPECDYMQEELPCTCGFLTAVERDFPEGA